MQGRDGTSDTARHDLGKRIALLTQRAMLGAITDARALASELHDIRRIAHANGLYPVAIVAHALESALARGERGPLIRGWLAMLDDAAGSDRQDADAGASFAAACSVRLAR